MHQVGHRQLGGVLAQQGAGQDRPGRQRAALPVLRHSVLNRCNIRRMAPTMVADAAARPDGLPDRRLLANGKARPELRGELRRIDDPRNALRWSRCGCGWRCHRRRPCGSTRWWAYLVAFVLMGPIYARFAILMHEAAHKLLFTNKRVNDWVGTWLVAYPAWTPIGLYRRGHFPTTGRSSDPTSRTSPSTAATRATGVRWPGGCSATRSASRAGRTSVPCSGVRSPANRRVASPSSASRPSCGPSCGSPPGGGGSTRCCGGCRG